MLIIQVKPNKQTLLHHPGSVLNYYLPTYKHVTIVIWSFHPLIWVPAQWKFGSRSDRTLLDTSFKAYIKMLFKCSNHAFAIRDSGLSVNLRGYVGIDQKDKIKEKETGNSSYLHILLKHIRTIKLSMVLYLILLLFVLKESLEKQRRKEWILQNLFCFDWCYHKLRQNLKMRLMATQRMQENFAVIYEQHQLRQKKFWSIGHRPRNKAGMTQKLFTENLFKSVTRYTHTHTHVSNAYVTCLVCLIRFRRYFPFYWCQCLFVMMMMSAFVCNDDTFARSLYPITILSIKVR